MSTIFKEILNKAPNITEEDLDDWVVPKLMDHYSARINSLSVKAYGRAKEETTTLPLMAFRERSKQELRNSIFTYLFKSEHWRTGRDINSYLLTSLKRLAQRIYWDNEGTQKTNVPVCPACRLTGRREFLHLESKQLRCNNCTGEIHRIEDERKDKDLDHDTLLGLDVQLRLRKCFSLHTRKGFRCPDCERFIPASYIKESSVSCPYPSCFYYSKDVDLQMMSHPMGLKDRAIFSIERELYNFCLENGGPSAKIADRLKANNVNADVTMEVRQQFEKEFKVVKDVMALQYSRVNKEAGTSFQKMLMYEAFQSLLDKNPEDMVSYLVHEKPVGEYPIQSRIFQEYCDLIEQSLPHDIVKNNETHSICSLLDPHLDLFTGISEFVTSVKADGSIPNNTIETYNGRRCFIGRIIDITNLDNDSSLRNHIKEYSFSKIKLDTDAPTGIPVRVEHFRILAHYEIGSLVHLQRIRRKIVDSVHFRLHGKKRESK